MESESHPQRSFRGMGLVSLSLGGVGQGASDDPNKETMLRLQLRSWNQVIDCNYFNPGMTAGGPPYGFDSSQGKNQSCTSSYLSHNSALPVEDLNLTLGFGCASKPFSIGASSSVSEVLTQDWQDDEQRGRVSVDLGLGLTTDSACELTITTLPSVPVLKGASFAGACLDLESAEGCWPDTGLESRAHGNSNSQHDINFSSFHCNNTKEIDLQLGLSGNSLSLDSDYLSDVPLDTQETTVDALTCSHIPVVDEGSTSARLLKSGGYMASLLPCRLAKGSPSKFLRQVRMSAVDAEESDGMMRQGTTSNVAVDAGESIQKGASAQGGDVFMRLCEQAPHTPSPGVERSAKTCKFKGCSKGARGASGLCIAHGGGRRCQRLNCNKGAEGRTMFCKAHGGGRRCQSLGCIKSAEGRTDFCIAHGGGRRCTYDDCTKAARGRSGLCIRHGGGKRCQKEGCTKSAEGFSGLCISHGGGRRCQYPDCGKGAQGSTKFCKGHGGGRRCEFDGCTKGAEGSTPFCKAHGGGKRCTFGGGMCTKSVHGGTAFCVAHGGGKRCSVSGCTKSARGRTDFCVKHGGGKRCKFDDCNKSAQGSTDYCKAHGGGKRCLWGQEGSVYDGSMLDDANLRGLKASCDKFARGKTGLCSAHNTLLEQYHPFQRSLSTSSLQGSLSDQLDTNQRQQPHSDLTEQTLDIDDEQSLHAGSQLAGNGEGSWRAQYQMPSTVVFKAQAASRCAATDISWQGTTDGFPFRHLAHGEYLTCGVPVQGSIFNRAAGNTPDSLYTGTIEHVAGSTEACFHHDGMLRQDFGASSSRVQFKRGRLDRNADLYNTTNDHEGRVHGGGHFMALLAREASSHDL